MPVSANISGPTGIIFLTLNNYEGGVSWRIEAPQSIASLIGFGTPGKDTATGTNTNLVWNNVPEGNHTITVTATDSRDSTCTGKTDTATFILTVEEDQNVYLTDPDCTWLGDPTIIRFPGDLQQFLPVYYQGPDYGCTLPWHYAIDQDTLPRFTLYAKTLAAVERFLRVASGDAVPIQSSIVGCGASHMHESIFRCSPDAPFIDIHQGDSVRPVCSLTVNIVDMGKGCGDYSVYEVTFSGYAEFKTCGSPGYVAGIYFPMGPDDFLADNSNFVLNLYCKNLKR